MVTGRHAADLLSGVLPTREHARLVLRAGLAGPPVRTSAALLYDEARVVALATRPRVTAEEVGELCPRGLYVARLRRTAVVDITAAWADRVEVVATRPVMPTMTAALIEAQIRAAGRFPWVATLCGFVVLCADASGLRERQSGTVTFDLTPPDFWAVGLEGRQLATRPGRPWAILEPGGAGLSARGGR